MQNTEHSTGNYRTMSLSNNFSYACLITIAVIAIQITCFRIHQPDHKRFASVLSINVLQHGDELGPQTEALEMLWKVSRELENICGIIFLMHFNNQAENLTISRHKARDSFASGLSRSKARKCYLLARAREMGMRVQLFCL